MSCPSQLSQPRSPKSVQMVGESWRPRLPPLPLSTAATHCRQHRSFNLIHSINTCLGLLALYHSFSHPTHPLALPGALFMFSFILSPSYLRRQLQPVMHTPQVRGTTHLGQRQRTHYAPHRLEAKETYHQEAMMDDQGGAAWHPLICVGTRRSLAPPKT